ncbi:MAG: undecaprenyl-diphosphatase UppP [Candidatus Omnitrophica bacterium]|nr:undecaprenyl-diphosphatase UppP [Candidatus Omnitrophota bacterium]
MNFIDTLILGVIEGVTEFLPISSTGHMILAGKWLQIPSTEFVKSFEIAIQLGAILAVCCLFRRRLFADIPVIKRVAAAFVPTMIIGGIFYKLIKKYLLGNAAVVVWALGIGGVIIILFENFHRPEPPRDLDLKNISYRQAVGIGLFQSLAVIPGVSRAAATIIGGMALGVARATIVEFSFLLAVPTMGAATVLDLMKSAPKFTLSEITLLGWGFGVSFLTALLVVRWLIGFVRTNNFIGFGVYRVVLACLAALVLLR